MEFDRTYDRWVWLYHAESENLKFPKKYSEIPENMHPLIIGSFFSKDDDEMYLDVRSVERAEQAAVFFDKFLDRSMAEFTDIAVTNRFVTAKNRQEFFNFDFLFDSDDVVVNSEDNLINSMDNLKQINDISGRRVAAFDFLLNKFNERYPDVEKFHSYFYEDGIEMLSLKLRYSQRVAIERFNGKEDITPFDMVP